ncbi:MAG: hypothetical protein IJX38_05280 [Clostridia bacterium]|nr:hypothetical protein [Clostridia bacterium]
MKKLIISKKLNIILYVLIFAVVLTACLLTPVSGEDFRYSTSFVDGTRVDSLGKVFPSAWAHMMNKDGRLVPTVLAQMLLVLPRAVYAFLGAAIFTLVIYLVTRISGRVNRKRRPNNAIVIMTFALIWLAAPRLGLACFTVVGGVFYLLPVLLGLLFLMPFIGYYMKGKSFKNMKMLWLYLPLSLIMGCMSVSASLAFIAAALALMVLGRKYRARRTRVEFVAALVLAIAGYVTLWLSPALWQGEGSLGDVGRLVDSVLAAFAYAPVVLLLPIIIYIVIYVRARRRASDILVRRMSLALAFSALLADILLLATTADLLSSLLAPLVLLLLATALLFPEARVEFANPAPKVVSTLLLGATLAAVVIGVVDIGITKGLIEKNEIALAEQRDSGNTYVCITDIPVFTKYSASFGGEYVDCERTDAERNDAMADYYGVSELIGVPFEWNN